MLHRHALGQRPAWSLTLLLAVALLLPAGRSVAAEIDEPPVLLRGTQPFTPEEAAGSGLAPEVQVRVTVDEQGRVAEVEVLEIKPSSEYDDLFRQVTVETVGSWRYAPARAGGEAVATTLTWGVQFQAREARDGISAGLGALFLPISADEEAQRARVFTLPPEEQAKRLRWLAASAERNLGPGPRRRIDSPRFVVITDGAPPETGEIVAGNLEAAFNILDGFLRPAGIKPQPGSYKILVYLYLRRESFSTLAGAIARLEWSDGLYSAPGLLTFHLEAPTGDTLLHTLLHEAVHAYADRHLVRPGFRLPRWLSEGLAEYIGNSEIKRGELILGRIPKGKYVLDRRRGGAFRVKSDAGWTLDRVKQAVRTGETPSIEEILAVAPEDFYAEQRGLYYALSWLLVHYLRHGEPGWAEEEFPALLLYLAEGYPSEAALEAVYDLEAGELEEPFRAYVKGF